MRFGAIDQIHGVTSDVVVVSKDEVLRQVVVADEDLGSILYRVRNEFKRVILTYKIMYEKATIHINKHLDLMVITQFYSCTYVCLTF